MELIEHFGIDPILIAAQIVNFLVILYILKRFLYKPLFETFKKREMLVKESLEKTDQARLALEKAQTGEKEIIKKAQKTATQILQDAKEQSAETLKQAEQEAQRQTTQMIAEAKVQIAQETKYAEQQLNKYVSTLSVEILKKSLTNVFTDKDQTVIVEKAIKSLKK